MAECRAWLWPWALFLTPALDRCLSNSSWEGSICLTCRLPQAGPWAYRACPSSRMRGLVVAKAGSAHVGCCTNACVFCIHLVAGQQHHGPHVEQRCSGLRVRDPGACLGQREMRTHVGSWGWGVEYWSSARVLSAACGFSPSPVWPFLHLGSRCLGMALTGGGGGVWPPEEASWVPPCWELYSFI